MLASISPSLFDIPNAVGKTPLSLIKDEERRRTIEQLIKEKKNNNDKTYS